jgi:autotransporter family porin
MNGVSDAIQGARNIGELKVGVEGKITDRLNLLTSVGQQIGGNGYNDTEGMLTVKYAF